MTAVGEFIVGVISVVGAIIIVGLIVVASGDGDVYDERECEDYLKVREDGNG